MKETPVFGSSLNFTACLEHTFGDHKGKLKGLIQMYRQNFKNWVRGINFNNLTELLIVM